MQKNLIKINKAFFKNTLKLMLSIVDCRILPKHEIDISDSLSSYFFDCLLSSFDLLFNPPNQFEIADKEYKYFYFQ